MLILGIPATLAIAACAGYNYVRIAYTDEQKLMAKEISEVKIPPDDEICQEAAKSANLEYPVEKPRKTPEQIAKEAAASAKILTDEKFSHKLLAKQIVDAIKSFKEVTPGQKVEFISRNSMGSVRGVYKGRDGIFVLVDTQKYSMIDILDEYRYLFDSNLATVKTQEKINELKTSFKDESSKYFEENRKRIEEELLASTGYIKLEGGNWRSKYDIFEEAFNNLKSQKENIRQEEIRKISRSHKLFGIYGVNPPEENKQ